MWPTIFYCSSGALLVPLIVTQKTLDSLLRFRLKGKVCSEVDTYAGVVVWYHQVIKMNELL